MKKYYSVFIVLLAATVMLSCKKNDPAKEKDYTASISERTWWGKFTNAGETAQYYYVHFNADKTVNWTQLSRDYQATWRLEGNKLTLNFSNPVMAVTADITEDDKLANITTNTPSIINSGELLQTSAAVLDNSVWKGMVSGFPGGDRQLELNFIPGNQVKVIYDNADFGAVSYFRSPLNGSIRFSAVGPYPFFGFNISGTEMRGGYYDYRFLWKLTKQ
jgi:hypothetical protein